jgi:hypothetical protein
MLTACSTLLFGDFHCQGVPVHKHQPPLFDSDEKTACELLEEHFVDADAAAKFLCCSRKHLLKLSILGKIPAHPLPGSGLRRTWRYLLSELRQCMLSARLTGLGRNSVKAVPSPSGGSRKGGR